MKKATNNQFSGLRSPHHRWAPQVFVAIVLALATGFAAVAFNPATAAAAATTTIRTIKTGSWTDPSIWNLGRTPLAGDAVEVATGHTVTLSAVTPLLSGVTIEPSAVLTFNPSANAVIDSTDNVVLRGTLRMRPTAAVVHRLTFQGFNETDFVGGGMNPVASDVGLWVMGAGQLDLSGSTKAAWSRLSGAASAGAVTITLESDPVGWRVGDALSVAPTEAPTVGAPSYQGFEDRKIVQIVGRTITLDVAVEARTPGGYEPGPGRWHV